MASQINEPEDTVKIINKSRSISSASYFDKRTNIEKPKEIYVRSDSQSHYGMFRPGASVTTEWTDK